MSKGKLKVCGTCGYMDDEWYKENPPLNQKNKIDVILTKKYCKTHVLKHGGGCEATWCEKCGNLKIYTVTLGNKKKV